MWSLERAEYRAPWPEHVAKQGCGVFMLANMLHSGSNMGTVEEVRIAN